jgi:hypothetical protein
MGAGADRRFAREETVSITSVGRTRKQTVTNRTKTRDARPRRFLLGEVAPLFPVQFQDKTPVITKN